MNDPSQDESLVGLFRKRNKDTKKEQGGVGTPMAMRPTEEGGEKPTHSDATCQMDLIDLSTRGTSVGNNYSYAMLCIDVGSRRARGELMKTRRPRDAVAALRRMRAGLGDIPMVLSTDKDTAFMNEDFQSYLRNNNIQHVTNDVMADSQLALVDSNMAQVKKHILMRMAQETDFSAMSAGALSWAEYVRSGPASDEPDWHPYFTEAVQKLNNKKLEYLMGRTIENPR